MKLLVEHVIFSPYTGVIHGGAEKSTYNQLTSLRGLGHTVDLLAPQDSTLPCIKAPVWSGQYVVQHGGVMKMKQWYEVIREMAPDYDGIFLNHGITSQSLLSERHSEWMSKTAYINRDGSGWYATGAGGMRLLTNIRWLRYNGGAAYYLCERNRDLLDWVWNHPKKGPEVRGQCCAGGVARIGHTDFFDLDSFDGAFNQWVFPTNTQPVQAPQGYLISVGRPDANKRLHLAAKLAKSQGRRLIICTTSRNTSSTGDAHLKIQQLLVSLGAEVRFDLPHSEIMSLVAGADCLLLPSKDENFSNVVCEAMTHGVPVSHLESQAPLDYYPSLSREWGDITPTTLEERQAAQDYLRETYTMDAYGQRLEALLP